MLVYLEWLTAYGLGRPSSIHAEECVYLSLFKDHDVLQFLNRMDLELPTEVDDEYWTNPDGEPLFQQPAGQPSKVSFFVQAIRLGQILAFATRTIVSILTVAVFRFLAHEFFM